jgi:Xaa-Pro aminopeptidase
MVFSLFIGNENIFVVEIGTAVITEKEALLWTDGRYFAQAEKELDSTAWKLMKDGTKDVLSITNWLSRVIIFYLQFLVLNLK